MKMTRLLSVLPASALAFALLATASPARADCSTPPCPPDSCDFPNSTDYTCYRAEKVTLAKATANVQFDNKLNTGWLNCQGTPKDPCNSTPSSSCSTIGVCLQVAMDDSKIDLSMQHDWDVFWPQIGKLQIVPRKRPNGGSFSVAYTLSPFFGVYLDVPGYKGNFSIDPLDILDALDKSGDVKEFKASASGSCKFDPFALDTPVECKVQQQDSGEVFSIPLSDIGIDIDKYVKIEMGLTAGTEDVVFSWQTDQITVDGADEAITKDKLFTNIAYTGGAEVPAVVKGKGTLKYKGKTFLKPAIKITQIAGFNINVLFPIDVGADLPFEGTIPINLNPTSFTIDLPDLFVPTSTIDFGAVEVGQKSNPKTVKLSNSGKMTSKVQAISSNNGVFQPQIPVFDIDPETDNELKVVFFPKQEGPIQATITVKSNDPDQPEQAFTVKGKGIVTETNGEGGGAGDGGSSGSGGSGGSSGKKGGDLPDTQEDGVTGSDGGCGCRAAGTQGHGAGAALAALALAGVVARRRRR